MSKKTQPICQFRYPKSQMKCIQILSPLIKNDINSNLHEICFQNFQKLVDMGLGLEISFHQFLLNLLLNEKTYLVALQCTI